LFKCFKSDVINVYTTIISTAPVLQTFQTADEYPLMEYHKGQPRRNSLNAKQTVRF